MLILGIETTCDETAAAVVEDGREVLSNVSIRLWKVRIYALNSCRLLRKSALAS